MPRAPASSAHSPPSAAPFFHERAGALEGVDGYSRDGLADEIERKIVEPLEVHATLAHVELLAGLLVLRREPVMELRVPVDACHVEGVVSLLRRKVDEPEWQLVIRVIAGRINGLRYIPTDHPVLEAFLVAPGQVPVQTLRTPLTTARRSSGRDARYSAMLDAPFSFMVWQWTSNGRGDQGTWGECQRVTFGA